MVFSSSDAVEPGPGRISMRARAHKHIRIFRIPPRGPERGGGGRTRGGGRGTRVYTLMCNVRTGGGTAAICIRGAADGWGCESGRLPYPIPTIPKKKRCQCQCVFAHVRVFAYVRARAAPR